MHLDDDLIKSLADPADFQNQEKELDTKEKKLLKTLLEKIFIDRGVDFRGYSLASIARRITRRMKAMKVGNFFEFGQFLDTHPEEYDRLFNEITVNVTQFFRNQKAFAALEKAMAPKMNQPGKSLKIWCAGCASGQEPYTMAIIAMKNLLPNQLSCVKILATDLDKMVLDFARTGVYDPYSVKDLSPDIVETFFTVQGSKYAIKPAVKDLVCFQQHNLVTDEFFKDMDIILCRNVLIYFNIPLQRQVINKFYKSLDSKGLLLLGRYEMLLKEARQQFSSINFDARLYQKKKKGLHNQAIKNEFPRKNQNPSGWGLHRRG